MIFNPAKFGNRVRGLRMRKGITREQLAEELCISTDHLCKIENGHRGTSFETLILMSLYFGVSTDYLLKGKIFLTPQAREHLEQVIRELEVVVKGIEDQNGG